MKVPQFPDLRTLVRRIPTAAWICALIACLNAVSWSFITPPFQVPDEPDHFAYVKQFAETGSRPTSGKENEYTSEEIAALKFLHYVQIRQDSSKRAIFSQAEQRHFDEASKAFDRAPEKGSPNAGSAASEPPLYYGLESIPYTLGSGGTLLDRVQLMRLLSALMAGITALFVFLFLRETLPGTRWAWSVGALGVALSPLLGFMSGAVNPDSMLFAASAALFYCIAHGFRRGLTTRSAIGTGVVIAVGFSTKLSFIGLGAGALIALGVLAERGFRKDGRDALRAPAIAAAIGCIPILIFLISSSGASRSAIFKPVTTALGEPLKEANFIWQLYLPRLPGTVNDFTSLSTTRQLWFDGYIGRFGWLDTYFPGWVYTVALVVAGITAALFVRGVLTGRAALRGRASEIAVYALMTLGTLLVVGGSAYGQQSGQVVWAQARYLLPMLPLLGAVFALSARGAGRRWGPSVGALIVILVVAHNLFSQLQVIARYYG
jgi:4-amino-4-deoxy-L-arabinose transferase-like glycosyltransferase